MLEDDAPAVVHSRQLEAYFSCDFGQFEDSDWDDHNQMHQAQTQLFWAMKRLDKKAY